MMAWSTKINLYDLAAEVRVYRPHTYADAMEMARLRDDRLQATKKEN